MIRFVHSADWQLGARFSQFGPKAGQFCSARIATLQKALALELSTDEPQVLILDDVLVNTDPVRQVRVLDMPGTHAARLQIPIFTCRSVLYKIEGQSLTLELSTAP